MSKFKKGNTVMTIKESYCETALHYGRHKKLEPIPKNFTLQVNNVWRNLYGEYCNVLYKKKEYDIKTTNLKLLR